MAALRKICVFCGSSEQVDAPFFDAAEDLGRALVRANLELVYGGARVGMMGRVADTVLQGGGRVTGVIPEFFYDRVGHLGLSETIVVESMHARKTKMYELADGFVTLPGGLGTMEEVFEILTWQQLGYHGKPCGLINAQSYFDSLLAFLNQAVETRFLKPVHRDLILVEAEATPLLERFKAFESPQASKWS